MSGVNGSTVGDCNGDVGKAGSNARLRFSGSLCREAGEDGRHRDGL